MKAIDLQIGSWVNYQGKNYQIHSLTPEYPFLDTEEFGHGVVEYKDLLPIKIKGNWYDKLGFVLNEDEGEWELYYEYELLMSIRIAIDDLVFIKGRVNVHILAEVHQVQNAFRLLTGVELNIK